MGISYRVRSGCKPHLCLVVARELPASRFPSLCLGLLTRQMGVITTLTSQCRHERPHAKSLFALEGGFFHSSQTAFLQMRKKVSTRCTVPFSNKLLTQPGAKGQWKGLFLKSGSGLLSITCVAESKVPSGLRALSPVSLLPRSSSSRSFVADVVNLFKALLGEDSLSPFLQRAPAPLSGPWNPALLVFIVAFAIGHIDVFTH